MHIPAALKSHFWASLYVDKWPYRTNQSVSTQLVHCVPLVPFQKLCLIPNNIWLALVHFHTAIPKPGHMCFLIPGFGAFSGNLFSTFHSKFSSSAFQCTASKMSLLSCSETQAHYSALWDPETPQVWRQDCSLEVCAVQHHSIKPRRCQEWRQCHKSPNIYHPISLFLRGLYIAVFRAPWKGKQKLVHL